MNNHAIMFGCALVAFLAAPGAHKRYWVLPVLVSGLVWAWDGLMN